MIAGISCQIPFFLTIKGPINPCASMVHEQIGYYYLISWIFSVDYHFIETGHASLAWLAYPVSLLIKTFDSASTAYEKIFHFGAIFYFLHGIILWLLTTRVLIEHNISLCTKFLFSISSLWVASLEKVSNLGLMINYHKGNEILNMCFIIWFLSLIQPGKNVKKGFLIKTGALIGLGVANKLSFGLIYIIFAVSCLWLWKPEVLKTLKSANCILISSCISFFISLHLLTGFRTVYVLQTIRDWYFYYQSNFLAQKTPFLAEELKKIFDPNGYYFIYEIILALFLFQICICSFWATKNRKGLYILAQLAAGILILAQLRTRFTQGTMVDSTLALQFFFLINLLVLENIRTSLRLVTIPLSILAAICILLGFFNMENFKKIRVLIHNSEKGQNISCVLKNSKLPIVFYLSGTPQPLIFPSAELITFVRMQNQSAKKYQEILLPNIHFTDAKKPLLFEHIGLLPEYEGSSARTEKNLKIWKEMYPPLIAESSLSYSFEGGEIFQFEPLQCDNNLLYYFVYPTIVKIKTFQENEK